MVNLFNPHHLVRENFSQPKEYSLLDLAVQHISGPQNKDWSYIARFQIV